MQLSTREPSPRPSPSGRGRCVPSPGLGPRLRPQAVPRNRPPPPPPTVASTTATTRDQVGSPDCHSQPKGVPRTASSCLRKSAFVSRCNPLARAARQRISVPLTANLIRGEILRFAQDDMGRQPQRFSTLLFRNQGLEPSYLVTGLFPRFLSRLLLSRRARARYAEEHGRLSAEAVVRTLHYRLQPGRPLPGRDTDRANRVAEPSDSRYLDIHCHPPLELTPAPTGTPPPPHLSTAPAKPRQVRMPDSTTPASGSQAGVP